MVPPLERIGAHNNNIIIITRDNGSRWRSAGAATSAEVRKPLMTNYYNVNEKSNYVVHPNPLPRVNTSRASAGSRIIDSYFSLRGPQYIIVGTSSVVENNNHNNDDDNNFILLSLTGLRGGEKRCTTAVFVDPDGFPLCPRKKEKRNIILYRTVSVDDNRLRNRVPSSSPPRPYIIRHSAP